MWKKIISDSFRSLGLFIKENKAAASMIVGLTLLLFIIITVGIGKTQDPGIQRLKSLKRLMQ